MSLMIAVFVGSALLGALSPLLTFVALFQMKEWRMDRLNEHLRREGIWGQLVGPSRLLLIGIFVSIMVLTSAAGAWIAASAPTNPRVIVAFGRISMICLWVVPIALAVLSLTQIIGKKQRTPVWTTKAVAITALAYACTVAAALAAPLMPPFIVLIIVLQPLAVMMAWAILKPVDTIFKRRVMQRATQVRSAMKDAVVIGIAGSVGKTTTKELIHHLLQDLHPLSTPAHVNTEMGVAGWLLSVRAQHAAHLLIIEMGAYRKGEIALLCEVAQPTIGVVTALGSDHLVLFGSEEAIVDANAELVESLPKSGHVFLDGSNASSASLQARSPCPVTVTKPSDTSDVSETGDGLRLRLHDTPVSIGLHGAHNVANIQLAVAVARHLGIQDDRIRELLKSFRPMAHTFNVYTEQGVTILDDTYNISPLSFHAALDWAAKRSERPRTLLTSGLLETGSEENRFLRELGAKAATCVERVIFTTDNGRSVFAEAYGGPVELLTPHTAPTEQGSVLLCVGRMSLSAIRQLLPVVSAATNGRASSL